MIRELTAQDIKDAEDRLALLVKRSRRLRQRMAKDGVEAFPAQAGTYLHSIKEAEKFAVRIEQAMERSQVD
ncbi:MAG: hypothetical protein AAGJ40_09830 [Planctomycetota bacterium]